jgi:2-amino-4-hydroxy-6-hydroxymethyldihydropteridine diphosphokinase/dihydropteroate synthase
MVVLGLGTNLKDKLANLRQAWQSISQIPHLRVLQVSPIYMSDALLPDNAPPDWNLPYLNLALRCETTLTPTALYEQLKKIETLLGKQLEPQRWAPRVIDIDILAWDEAVINSNVLIIPHKHLLTRPFALWPLADVAPLWFYQGKTAAQWVENWGSRFSGNAPFHTRQINQRIDTPELVGIINVTPDSFADGGQFFNPNHAAEQAIKLLAAGASVLDIGAESTAPSAQPIDSKEEWNRLAPALKAIIANKNNGFLTPKISLDTRHVDVAEKALALGIDWINDVSGLDDPDMCHLIASAKVDCVVMHHLNIPETRDKTLLRDQNPVKIVYEWGEKRLNELEKLGIPRERIIFDPGIGFGKMAEQSFTLLKHISVFTKLGTRLLSGHSRKSYLSLFTDLPFAERDIETTTLSLYLAKQHVAYLRLHQVEMCARAFKVNAAL